MPDSQLLVAIKGALGASSIGWQEYDTTNPEREWKAQAVAWAVQPFIDAAAATAARDERQEIAARIRDLDPRGALDVTRTLIDELTRETANA